MSSTRRVLLIKPDYIHDIANIPPVGLCYIASLLETKGIDVSILDNTLESLDVHEIKKILNRKQPTLVGISCSTPMLYRAHELAELVKNVNPEIHVCMGGPHPTALPAETLSNPFVDSVCIGEGEYTTLELYKSLNETNNDLSNVKGIVYKDMNGKINFNEPRTPIQNLDDLPFPAFHLLDVEKYFMQKNLYGINTIHARNLPIMTSRGCPSRCTFCQRFMGTRFRYRSAKNVVDEIEHLLNTYKIEEIHFIDDNFTLIKDRTIEICDEIISRRLNISFKFPNGVRADRIDRKLLLKLKEAGCYALDFGIESGSQRVLDMMKKGIKIEEIRETVRLSKEIGFNVTASFIFGTPRETLDDMGETINFAKSLSLNYADFGIAVPYPGTELYEEAMRNNCIKHFDYDKYVPTLGVGVPALETEQWTADDLLEMQRRAYRKFYFRVEYILSSLPNLLQRNKFKKYFKFFKKTIGG